MLKRIFINATVLTMNDKDEIIKSGALGIEDNKITYVGETPKSLEEYNKVIDCKSKAILPGLINTHCHAGMSLLRGYGDDLPLKTWLEDVMWPMEGKFGKEQVRAGTMLSVLEMLKSGTTCFVDMYDQMDTVAEVVLEAGIRATLCRGMIGFGSKEEKRLKIKESTRFTKYWKEKNDDMIQTMMSPHAPYTCDPEFIKEVIEVARELDVPVHTHISETSEEVERNVKEYGYRPVEHLLNIGFFDIPCLVAHAVHLNDKEIDILHDKDVKIAHNPGSNLKLGSGIARIPKMFKKGLKPGLATDSAASNNNLCMLEEIHLAALIHKGFNEDPLAVNANTALKMGTIYGAECLFRKDIGSLEVGKKADFILMDLAGVHMQPVHDVRSQIVYSASREDVTDVFINGKEIVKDRICTNLDEEKIIHEANKAFNDIL